MNTEKISSLNNIVNISAEIDRLLIKEGFTLGSFDDCYSGAENRAVFHKSLGNDDGDYLTAVVTSNEIGIEREYNYGGGQSAGLWKFKTDDFESFKDAYNDFVHTVQVLVKNGMLL